MYGSKQPVLKNSTSEYGWIGITLHWGMAVVIIGLFALGLYMTSLDYYDPWYQKGPNLHRSIGVLLLTVLVFRLVWRIANPRPEPLGDDPPVLHKAAELVHRLLYLFLFAIAFSGYLISTADGRAVEVFDWFSVPALLPGVENLEDYAGEVHLVLAITLMVLVGVHAAGALKHHFIDKDRTLLRMLGINK
ncbi:MAG: cytochrome b [Gammaproteobacteria bacterium]|nr:cytochrome b [Gammaproteobacteria bacterium]